MGTDEKRILVLMNKLYSELIACKPGDRSWLDRIYAITVSDTEHLIAYWAMYAEAERFPVEEHEDE